MTALRIALLVVAVAGAVARPRGLPTWAVPLACVAVGLAVGAVTPSSSFDAARPLLGALAFLLAAVPLAVLLDRAGVFTAAADRLGTGGLLVPGLWLLAIVTTALLNLDASVVLLTPLYLKIADRSGYSRLFLGAQPLVLSFLASSFLPASNLTNLIAVARLHVGAGELLGRLGPPSVVACAVGYACYRRWGDRQAPRPSAAEAAAPFGAPPAARRPVGRPLVLGAATVAWLLVGFLAGPPVGVQPWMVVLVADVAIALRLRRVPLKAVPVGTALVAGSLAVLADAAASGIPLGAALHAGGALGLLATFGLAAVGGTLVNNLPACLVGLRFVGGAHRAHLWPLLLGVNMGPALLVTGTLAALLWADAMRSGGVRVGAGTLWRVGIAVTVPAALAAALTLVALAPLYS